ncbi:MAG: GH3 family domain-containing protein, partial [Longimicrobiales bacterium]
MISLAPGVCNRLWMLSSLGAWRAFQVAAEDPREAQQQRLRSILRWNAGSEYGTRFGFEEIRSAEVYRRRVPVVRYDDLAPELEAVRQGRGGVLTTEPPLLLQPSSGSTAATKLIPYTASLKRELNRAVSVWMGDLFWNRPELLDGPAYWSVSPLPAGGRAGPESAGVAGVEGARDPGPSAKPATGAVGAGKNHGSVRVGFDEDAAYLGGLTRSLVSGALAVPGEVGRISDPALHRYVSLRYLLGAPELRIFSVWSPTFLALLLEPLARWWDRLVEDVEAGTLRFPGSRGLLEEAGFPPMPPDPRRARELRAVGPDDLPGIWPRLGLLSAWADGASAP